MENPEQKLKGTLINKNKKEEVTGITPGEVIVQRDSGKEYIVASYHPRGPESDLVKLRGSDGSTINLNAEELLNKLNTPGSAWSRKE